MLEIQHVSKSFYRKTAVNDVSLRVSKGEIFGLLGPNGAGKTTLIRMINRIIEPDKGIIKLNDEVMRRSHLLQVGYLPEERGLYKSMTVADHALFLAKLRGLDKRLANEQLSYWLEKFSIENWRTRRIEELSKGMAQKVQFICAVIHDPNLLILDEPLSGFDPINVEMIKQELLEMKAKGKAIILSTHNMRSVDEICDRAALIFQGEKIAEGKIASLQDQLKTGEFIVKFRGSMIAFVNALWVGFELIDKEILGDDRFIARVKMRGENQFEDLLKVLMGAVKIEAASEVIPTMQDVFIGLIAQKNGGKE